MVNFYTNDAGYKTPHFQSGLIRFSQIESVQPAQNVELNDGPVVMIRTKSGNIIMCKGKVEDFAGANL
jgi:hypothetical protein